MQLHDISLQPKRKTREIIHFRQYGLSDVSRVLESQNLSNSARVRNKAFLLPLKLLEWSLSL